MPISMRHFTEWTVEKLWQAGAHLMGSVTYGDMAAHWPSSTEPYAAPMNQIPKIVFSRSLKEANWGETRIVSDDLAQEVSRLKQESGKDLLVHGDARFAQSLVKTGLVDEYRLVVHPKRPATIPRACRADPFQARGHDYFQNRHDCQGLSTVVKRDEDGRRCARRDTSATEGRYRNVAAWASASAIPTDTFSS